MVGTATITGGARAAGVTLSAAEQLAAQQALAKLAGTVASSALPSIAALSAASATPVLASAIAVPSIAAPAPALHALAGLKSAASGLVLGGGNDSLTGGVPHCRSKGWPDLPSDSVSGGSATNLPVASVTGQHAPTLGADVVQASGVTAAGVKAQDPASAHTGAHTITLVDKTVLTITGAGSHSIVKPH